MREAAIVDPRRVPGTTCGPDSISVAGAPVPRGFQVPSLRGVDGRMPLGTRLVRSGQPKCLALVAPKGHGDDAAAARCACANVSVKDFQHR